MAELSQLANLPRIVLQEMRTFHVIIQAEETQVAARYLDLGDLDGWLRHFDRANEAFHTVLMLDSLLTGKGI